ncbi:Fis family transcriptional regulator [Aquitalea sp. S1-19]|nr:Fis family transcriptional regulator [Aquitalea sp. S1-19]MCP9760543.1 Fis family transcriptional regulator [Aquitalea sp. S1-19]MCP9760569.1 Fis family transcriptional regulator [Aquitalea sp. S1-19]MCP9760581.1 Fis family transcriptional regulator [Aquitalea sp. S1-19]MCP9760608.1 Fis family transcriptional regulator [Aquitalea sp. S1-19]
MIETEARVLRVEPGAAWVEPKPHSPCGQCDAEGGCRSLSIARLFSGRDPVFRVLDSLGVGAGDQVMVAVPEKSLRQSVLLMYVLPLLALFAGALLGALFGEMASALAGLGCLLLSLLLVRRRAQRLSEDGRFQPHIASKLDPDAIVAAPARTCRSKNRPLE